MQVGSSLRCASLRMTNQQNDLVADAHEIPPRETRESEWQNNPANPIIRVIRGSDILNSPLSILN